MGAWGVKVFENDTALDTIAEMSELIEHYYKGLVDSEDEHNIILAGFIYLVVTSKDRDKMIDEVSPDQLLRHEIDFVAKGLKLANIEQYKYKLIGNLYKCLDCVKEWNENCRVDREKEIKKMIECIGGN